MANQPIVPPFKSIAGALLFSVLLGPVGLLYSSYWGGFFMIFVTIMVVNSEQMFLILLAWLVCAIWSVGAAESYNRKIIQASRLEPGN